MLSVNPEDWRRNYLRFSCFYVIFYFCLKLLKIDFNFLVNFVTLCDIIRYEK